MRSTLSYLKDSEGMECAYELAAVERHKFSEALMDKLLNGEEVIPPLKDNRSGNRNMQLEIN